MYGCNNISKKIIYIKLETVNYTSIIRNLEAVNKLYYCSEVCNLCQSLG